MEIDSEDTTVNRPMGRFAWTNHIYFQITQPGISAVAPLYQCGYHKMLLKKEGAIALSGSIMVLLGSFHTSL
jgi:hypothetical protein